MKGYFTRQMERLKSCGSVRGFIDRVKYKREMIKALKAHGSRSFPTEAERESQSEYVFPHQVKFSILTPLYNTPEDLLMEMIMSALGQTYQNFELCLADGSDKQHAYVERVCKTLAEKDPRIIYKKLEKNEGISGNTNKCLEMATGDYIGLLDHDDILHPEALFEYAKAINEQGADFLYCDESTFKHGNIDRLDVAHFKPDFAIDNLRSNNYICHFTCFKRTLLDNMELFRPAYDGSQDHDMILRLTSKASKIVHIPRILYYWRSHSGSVAADLSVKSYAVDAAIRAVHDHLTDCGFEDPEVTSTKEVLTHYRIKYKIKGEPLVSIVIPNKDHVEDLRRCIDSILTKSIYKKYEIIVVENNSETVEIQAYYKELENEPRVRVVTFEGEFNYSAVNNLGVQTALGEYILLLNNDCEVISPEWIEEMLMFAQRQDVGAVGAKLIYPDGNIQHAGVILGLGPDRIAGHIFYHMPGDYVGYMGRMTYAQNLSAVTGACLMVARSKFTEVDGLDESFKVCLNDVDFCLKLRRSGYLNVWTPFAVLTHYESVSRGFDESPEKVARFAEESRVFRERWDEVLAAGDPFYNPNLSLDFQDCRVKMNHYMAPVICPLPSKKGSDSIPLAVRPKDQIMKKSLEKVFSRLFMVGIAILLQILWICGAMFLLTWFYKAVSIVFMVLSVIMVFRMLIKWDYNPSYVLAWSVPMLVFPVFGLTIYFLFGRASLTRKKRRRYAEIRKKYLGYLPLYLQDAVETGDGSLSPLTEQNCQSQSNPNGDREPSPVSDVHFDESIARQTEYITKWAGYPLWTNTYNKYYESGEVMFPDMLEELKKAKHFIYMEFFIINTGVMWDSVLEILEQKVKEGVDVRLTYDDVGSISYLPAHYYKYLQSKGIKCAAFNPFRPVMSVIMNNRNHRKILVIDGHTAFTGGINLADEYINAIVRFGYWKDTGIMLKGPAVWSFTLMFLSMWEYITEVETTEEEIRKMTPAAETGDGSLSPLTEQNCQSQSNPNGDREPSPVSTTLTEQNCQSQSNPNGDREPSPVSTTNGDREPSPVSTTEPAPVSEGSAGYLQPYCDSPLDKEYIGENVYRNIISRAKHYCYIYTPYLIIGNEMMTTICIAAKSGVDVRIITPEIPDKPTVYMLTQSYYERLIKAGVKVYQFTPGFIHAKCFVCDDEIATVGSINLDFRSLYMHFECGVWMYKTDTVMDVKRDFLETQAQSREIDLEFCRNKPLIKRATQAFLRLFAPVL